MLHWCQHKHKVQSWVLYMRVTWIQIQSGDRFFCKYLERVSEKGVSVVLAITGWVEQSGNDGLGFWGFLSLSRFCGLFGVLWIFGGTCCHIVAARRKVVASHGNVVLTIQRKTSTLENSIRSEPLGSTVVDKWSFREIYTRQCKLN